MLSSPNNPEKSLTLGILGGGQLAKMLANEAYRMGLNVSIIENHAESPAGDMTKQDFTKGWEDSKELKRFIDSCDVVTLENEFIDPKYLEKIEKEKPVYPSSFTMKLVQDKLTQKNTFKNFGIDVPVYEDLPSQEHAAEFGEKHGYPFVMKARKYGYDGYGNATIDSQAEAYNVWNKFNDKEPRMMMAEKFVDFTMELAVMVARDKEGNTRVYPCVQTIQKDHICHTVIAPAEIDDKYAKKAQEMAVKCVESIDGIGVFGVELFLTKEGNVLVNEIAPRPHNSGHYTIEACYSSQFENAIRAVLGLPLGSPDMVTPASCLINTLGEREGVGIPANVNDLMAVDKVWLHLYNKKQSRVGRKMGHITALGNNQKEAINLAESAIDKLKW